MSPNIIDELLAKSVKKLRKQQVEQEKCEQREASINRTDNQLNKSNK